jgi:hypothetical protein
MPIRRDVLLPEAADASTKLRLLATMQIFEVQLDQPWIVEIGCKVMGGQRRIPAHAGDRTPNLGRQMIDTFRIPGIIAPCLTVASECTRLIGK